MDNLEDYLLAGLFFILICICWFAWRKKRSATGGSNQFVRDTLEQARSQFEVFNIKLSGDGAARNGISAMLGDIDRQGLHFDVNDYVPDGFVGRPAAAYFKVRVDDVPVFYAFSSQVVQIKADMENSHLLLTVPEQLRVEKKRHFIRVKPDKKDVLAISVWSLEPGRKLPMTTEDMPPPITQFKKGAGTEAVQLENISATGIALRFALDKNDQPPIPCGIGSQFVCLVVYAPDEKNAQDTTTFWCTGEVKNSRIADGARRALVLGLEFTNWAVLKGDDNEIHWAHSSPSRGVKPILQWVEKMDRKEARGQ